METKKNRLLYVRQFLETQTDEQHPAHIADIIAYLESLGIPAGRKAVTTDIEQLIEFGVDVICNDGRQREYFIGDRVFELPELILLIGAVQAARFISPKKTRLLIGKLAAIAGVHQGEQLNRNLYIDRQAKTANERVFYTADLLYAAIRDKQKITFKYYEYTGRKQKVYKHNKQVYRVSPYAMLWNSDCYYALGYSDSHGRIITFRVDRIAVPELSKEPAVPAPKGFDPSVYTKGVFQMYDGTERDVTLKCENSLMKSVVDRFGEDVDTVEIDDGHFRARVHVSASPTFYGWVFGFAGKMEITAPKDVRDGYISLARLEGEKAR